MKRMKLKKAIALLCAMAMIFTTSGMNLPVYAVAAPSIPVPSGGSGSYTNELTEFSNIVDQDNIETVSGSAVTGSEGGNGVAKALNLVTSEPVVYGNSVPFDASGYYTDELAGTEALFKSANVTTASDNPDWFKEDITRVVKDSETGDGYLVYNAGDGESFNSLTVNVGGFSRYDETAFTGEHIKVYTAVRSGDDITYDDSDKLVLDQEIATDKIGDSGYKTHIAMSFIPRIITDGTQYLVIALPDTCFQITSVNLEKVDSDSVKYTQFLVDDFNYANASAADVVLDNTDRCTNILQMYDSWDFSSFCKDYSLIKAQGDDSSGTDAAMNYDLDWNIKYVYLLVYNWHNTDQHIDDVSFAASTDGTNYSKVNAVLNEIDPIWAQETQPKVYRITNLPKGTTHLRVLFHNPWSPVLSKLILKGVTPEEDNVMASAVDTLDNLNKVYDISDNLRFESNEPSAYNGDASRIRRTADEDAYVVYKTTSDIKSAEFDSFAFFGEDWGSEPDDLRAYVSADGTDFSTEIPLTRTPSAAPEDHVNYAYHYVNTNTIPDGYQYIKIAITGHSWDGSVPQLGNVKLGGFAPFAFDSPAQGTVSDELANLNNIKAASENIVLATSDADGYSFEDASRATRAADSSEDFTFDYNTTTEIRSASVEVYAYYDSTKGYAPNPISILASTDGVSYSADGIELSKDVSLDANGGWQKLVYSTNKIPSGSRYIRISYHGVTDKAPQIGKVTLSGINTSDAQFNIIPGISSVEHSATANVAFTQTPINIDGVITTDAEGKPTGEWAGAELMSINVGDNMSAGIYMKYDYDNVYYVAKIKDPSPLDNTNTGSDLWAGDNMELFFGTEDIDYIKQPGKMGTMLASDIQLVLSGGVVNGIAPSYVNKNGDFSYPTFLYEVKADEDGQGYTMEAAIPLSVLGVTNPWDNYKMLFNAEPNIYVDGNRNQAGWSAASGESKKKSRGLWGLLTFEPASAPAVEIMVDASYAAASTAVTITATAAEVKGKAITLLVKDSLGNIVYVDQKASNTSGSATFTYKSSVAGNYTVYVGGEGIGRANSTAFSISNDNK